MFGCLAALRLFALSFLYFCFASLWPCFLKKFWFHFYSYGRESNLQGKSAKSGDILFHIIKIK
jgi:hypothetical protein